MDRTPFYFLLQTETIQIQNSHLQSPIWLSPSQICSDLIAIVSALATEAELLLHNSELFVWDDSEYGSDESHHTATNIIFGYLQQFNAESPSNPCGGRCT